jgi:hypothetical protein
MPLTDAANKRGCYCGLWDTKPEVLEQQGVPYGYCGFCEKCGRPGHTRHFPGAVPYTGCWCEYHYRMLLWFDPRSALGCFVWLVVLLGTLTWWLTR